MNYRRFLCQAACLAVVMLFVVNIADAVEVQQYSSKANKPKKVSISLDMNMLFSPMIPGGLMVFGEVKSLVKNERVTFWPKISLDAYDKDKKQVLPSTWTVHIKDGGVFTVEPEKTERLFCVAGGTGTSMNISKYSGKGSVSIYVTEKEADGIDDRISNLITLDVDFDKSSATIKSNE